MASGETVFIVVVVLASSLLFSGLVYGWAPLQLMLLEDGQYSELCDEHSTTGVCVGQTNAFSVIFTFGMFFVTFSALPEGLFLDWVKPMTAIATAGVLQVAGLLLLAVSDSVGFNYFIPAYSILGVAGQMTMLAAYPASFLIPSRQNGILAGISCLFDASSIVFMVFYWLHQGLGYTRRQLLLAYSAFAVVMYVLLVILWKRNQQFLGYESVDDMEAEVKEAAEALVGGGETRKDYGTAGAESAEAEVPFQNQTLKEQILSKHFAFLLVYSSLGSFRANTYVGTQNQLLIQYGDAEFGYFYTELFGIILPMGCLLIPIVEKSLDRGGLTLSLHVTSALGIVYNVLQFVRILWVQSLASLIFTFFRAFFYSVFTAFAAQVFGLSNLGTIIGVAFTGGAFMNIAQAPAIAYINEHLDGNLAVLNAVLLAMAVFVLISTEVYRYSVRTEQKAHDLPATLGKLEDAAFAYMVVPSPRRLSLHMVDSALSPRLRVKTVPALLK